MRETDKGMKRAARDHDKAVRQADKGLKSATREYNKAVHHADRGIKRAARDYNGAVLDARSQLERAKTPQKLARLNSVVLHDDHIQTPSGFHWLNPNVRAAVDSAGNLMKWQKSRTSLTRIGVGGLVLGPLGALVGASSKKHRTGTADTRELYLIVEGDDWADTAKCNPNEGKRAREFAQAINLAARNVERVKAERTRRVKELGERLAAVEADRSGIEVAERTRAAVQADRSGIGAAEQSRAALDDSPNAGLTPPGTQPADRGSAAAFHDRRAVTKS
jgi:hypothetical protein